MINNVEVGEFKVSGPAGAEYVLAWLGVDCCFQAVWNWKETLADTRSDPLTAE
jgi:hypothetical protein